MKGRDIICFAPADWWAMNCSCTTHIMKRLSKENRILYVNPFSSDIFGESKNITRRIPRKIRSLLKYLRRVDKNIYVFSPLFLPFHGRPFIDGLNNFLIKFQFKILFRLLRMKKSILWIENLRAADLIDFLRSETIIYHVSDLFTKSRYVSNKEKLIDRENQIIKKAKLVVCVSRSLYDIQSTRHNNVVYLPHGVDFALFNKATVDNISLKEISHVPRPIAGYYGTMTVNNDIELLTSCAQSLSKVSFVLVGQITSGDYSKLAKLPNVYLLGKVPYEEIPMLCLSFDVCLLQWKMTVWIRHCNPLKMMEYMASGKPIVSVPINEVVNKYSDLVSIAYNKNQFRDAIIWEIENDTPERSSKRVAVAKEHNWERHIARLSKEIMNISDGYEFGDTIRNCMKTSLQQSSDVRI